MESEGGMLVKVFESGQNKFFGFVVVVVVVFLLLKLK